MQMSKALKILSEKLNLIIRNKKRKQLIITDGQIRGLAKKRKFSVIKG